MQRVPPCSLVIGLTTLLVAGASSGAPCTPATPNVGVGCQTPQGSTSYDVLISSKTTPTWLTGWQKGGWKTRTAYDCRLVECSHRDADPGPLDVSIERKTSVCWSVGGSVTIEAKLKSLLTRLFGELGVTVEVNGNYTSCVDRTDTIAGHVPSSQCYHTSGRVINRDAKTDGEDVWAEAVTQWTWQCDNGLHWATTDCGRTTYDGKADRISDETFQIAPPSVQCGGPNPPDQQFDGKTKVKCCTPLPGCDQNANPPCCDCWG